MSKIRERLEAMAAQHGAKVVSIDAAKPAPKPEETSHPAAAPLPAFDRIEQEANSARETVAETELAAALDGLNAEFFVAPEGGKVRIFRETHDHELSRRALVEMTGDDFRLLLKNRHARITDGGGNTKKIPLAEAWLSSPARREYLKGLALLPGGNTPPGIYNLWRGWGIEPICGDAAPALKHIHTVICGGDAAHSRYLIRWLARCVQSPQLPAEVAVVLQGGRGAGKGTLARWIRDIFGEHGLQIAHARHLTGNFNAHLRACAFLFVDEGFWAGDRAGEGVLKALITEDQIAIERKGRDVFSVRNRLKILIATNSEWAVPAGLDERRFFVLSASKVRQQDHDYFSKLNTHMETGGLAALLDYLLHLDITGFNIRQVPSTCALEEQKILSLPPFEAWLFAALHSGGFGGTDEWQRDQPRERLCRQLAEHVNTRGVRHVDFDARSVGRKLRAVFPSLEDAREVGGARLRFWRLPSIAEARADFARFAHLEHIEWPDL